MTAPDVGVGLELRVPRRVVSPGRPNESDRASRNEIVGVLAPTEVADHLLNDVPDEWQMIHDELVFDGLA